MQAFWLGMVEVLLGMVEVLWAWYGRGSGVGLVWLMSCSLGMQFAGLISMVEVCRLDMIKAWQAWFG